MTENKREKDAVRASAPTGANSRAMSKRLRVTFGAWMTLICVCVVVLILAVNPHNVPLAGRHHSGGAHGRAAILFHMESLRAHTPPAQPGAGVKRAALQKQ